jgi:PHP family Zn ribbon phosphoesterase
MSDFFQSEMVRGDLQELAKMQEYCMKAAHVFPALAPVKKLEYFDILQEMIEKQKVFYTRLKLSDDPEATEMADSIKQAAVMFGEDANVVFDELIGKIEEMRQHLKAEGY